ncbi:MAG: thermonuclease family protein [Chloroflexi bacterium]|nr:thermonuclease family protein [Chloroflexota bacterium]
MSGVVETLRLIGIDTPEVVDPRTDIQCYGPEASARAKALLEGKRVRIQGDSTQDTRDRYGRLLAYVWLEDGTFYNLVMVQEGYAREYTYDRAYQYQADFRAAEAEAKATKWGLWGACAVEAAPTPDPGPDAGDVYYANCTEARAAGAAPIYRGQPGYRPGLDRDNDGVACE